MENSLYICSSMRHLFLAMGMAYQLPQQKHHLLLIQQPATHLAEPVFAVDSGPFQSITYLPNRKGTVRGYLARRQAMQKIASVVQLIAPSHIFAGNDRRIEFQYAMYCARQSRPATVGGYLDDGTGSYINGVYIDPRRAWVDLTIDRRLKRLFYGSWYDKQLLLGGTRWVDECYLTFPEQAPEQLRAHKKIIPLTPQTYRAPEFVRFLERFLPSTQYETGNQDIESQDIESQDKENQELPACAYTDSYQALMILPLSKQVANLYPSIEQFNAIVNEYLESFTTVAVKYHPRETNFYYQGRSKPVVFPAALPAELLFSMINVELIVGDLSSALLSAVWLLPASRTICLCSEGVRQSPLFALMQKTAIEMVVC